MDIKKILSLLAILLPAFIILLGIIRLFVKRTAWVNGLIMFVAVALLIVALMRHYFFPERPPCPSGPPPVPLAVGKHSNDFNGSVQSMFDAYTSLTQAFVKKDTALVNKSATTLKITLDSLKIEELKKDTASIYESALDPLAFAKAEIDKLLAAPLVENKKMSFNILSGHIQTLLSIVRFDREMIYMHECPLAFGEGQGGYWLSRTKEETTNPYIDEECAEYRAKISDTTGVKQP